MSSRFKMSPLLAIFVLALVSPWMSASAVEYGEQCTEESKIHEGEMDNITECTRLVNNISYRTELSGKLDFGMRE